MILVTGGAGLVGHAVTSALAGHCSCVGHDSRSPADPVPGVQYVTGDLLDFGSMLKTVREHHVTHIVHSGAISHPLLLADRPTAIVAANVDGTLNILDAARQAKVKRVVFLSSGAVYGSMPPGGISSEASPLEPDNIYGASKAAAEMLVQGYRAIYGMDVVILRPVSVYGPRRQTFSVPGYLLACALDGIAVRLSGGDQEVDFIFVDDVVRAVLLALNATTKLGRAYNIATGQKQRYADIAAMVRELIPKSDITTEPGLGDLPPEGSYSTQLAANDLGFRTTVDFERGLRSLKETLADRPDLRAAARAAARMVGSFVDEIGHSGTRP